MINRRWVGYGPPNYPFVLNRESQQARGLVAWWPMLASGGNIAQEFLDGRNATIQGGTLIILGQFGRTFDQDATDGNRASFSNLLFSGEFTFAMFIKPADISSSYILCGNDKVGTTQYLMAINTTSTFVRTDLGVLDFRVNSGLSVGTWNLVSMTRDSNDIVRYYFDGIEKANGSRTGLINVQSLGGWNTGVASASVDGSYTEARIWNRALTPIEVYQLYALQTRWELYQPVQRSWPIVPLPPPPPPPPLGPISLGRLYNVPAEDRIYVVPSEGERIYEVPAEDRIYEVPQ